MSQERNFFELTAREIALGVNEGRWTAEAVTRSFLERCSAIEDEVRAWAALDPDLAIEQARAVDRDGREKPLAGVPFGVKDIFETADYATEYGSPIYKGYRPPRRRRLRCAGPRCRRRHSGQDEVNRVRRKQSDGDAKPPRPEPDARRLVERLRGGRRSVDGSGGDGHADRRLGDPAGVLLRRRRLQADFRLSQGAGLKPSANSLDTVGYFARNVGDVAEFSSLSDGRQPFPKPEDPDAAPRFRRVQDRGMVRRRKRYDRDTSPVRR